jgi:NADH dehydrogenase
LIEGGERVLPPYPPDLSARAQISLEHLGVEVWNGAKVIDVAPGRVLVERGGREELLEAATVLWAAGVRASSLGAVLAQRAGAELDRQGRVLVDEHLALRGRRDVFVVGDLAHCEQPAGTPLPGVAPVAMQQGRYVGKLVLARLRGRELAPFRYRDKGNLAVIGRSAAVADLRGRHFSGHFAWLLWLFVHLMYLVGFANRVLVFVQWAWNYFTRNRTARLITGEPEQRTVN